MKPQRLKARRSVELNLCLPLSPLRSLWLCGEKDPSGQAGFDGFHPIGVCHRAKTPYAHNVFESRLYLQSDEYLHYLNRSAKLQVVNPIIPM